MRTRLGRLPVQRLLRSRCVGVALALLTWGAGMAVAQDRPALGPKDGAGLPPSDLGRVAVGAPAPDFTLESKEGATVTLSSFRERKNVVLVFYRGHW